MPFRLALEQAMIARVADQAFAVPVSLIEHAQTFEPGEVSGTGSKKAPAPAGTEPPRPAEPAAPATGRPAERTNPAGDETAPIAPPQPAPGDKPSDKTRKDIDVPSAEQPKPPGGNP